MNKSLYSYNKFIYLGSARLMSFKINFISKETSRADPEYMNIHPPPPISVLATALDVFRRNQKELQMDPYRILQINVINKYNCSISSVIKP